MKGFLGLLAIWFAGFCLLILRFGVQSDFTTEIPKLLIFCLLASPILILLFQRWETRVKNEKIMLFFLILFGISLRLVSPLTDGTSTFVANIDPIYNFQLATIYSEYGHWIWGLQTGIGLDVLFTPMLHLLSVVLSQISGIDLFNICRFTPAIVFTPIVLLLLFCTFRRFIGSQKALLACFIFALCYKYNSFTSLYLPESLGIVFFALALYGLVSMKSERESGREYSVVFILASAMLVSTHFLSSFIFLVAITVGLLVGKIFKSADAVKSSIKTTDFMIFTLLLYAWLLFVAYHLFIVQTNYVSNYFNEIVSIILSPFETRTVQGVQEAGLSFWESTVAYGGILIFMLFGLLTCFNLFIRRSASQHIYLQRTFAAISFVLMAVTAVGLFAIVESHDVAYRFFTFMYIFLAPTAAISIEAILRREKPNRKITINRLSSAARSLTLGIFIVILVTPVLSTGLLFPPFTGEQITYDDEEIVATSKWFSPYVNKSAVIVGEITLGAPITALAKTGFWREGEAIVRQSAFETMIDAIYYGGNLSALLSYLQQQNAVTILILDKHFVDHNHFLLFANTRAKIPTVDAMNNAFHALDQTTLLNKIYEGDAPTIYIVSTGN
jgi:hypothetical protein